MLKSQWIEMYEIMYVIYIFLYEYWKFLVGAHYVGCQALLQIAFIPTLTSLVNNK